MERGIRQEKTGRAEEEDRNENDKDRMEGRPVVNIM